MAAARRKIAGHARVRRRGADAGRYGGGLGAARSGDRNRRTAYRNFGKSNSPDLRRVARRPDYFSHQPDRAVRDRGTAGGLRDDRAQNNRRHVRRVRAARGRSIFRKRSVENRPIRGVRRAMGRQKSRRGRTRKKMRGAAGVRDRGDRAGERARGHVRHERPHAGGARADCSQKLRPHAERDHPRSRSAMSDVPIDCCWWALRADGHRAAVGAGAGDWG